MRRRALTWAIGGLLALGMAGCCRAGDRAPGVPPDDATRAALADAFVAAGGIDREVIDAALTAHACAVQRGDVDAAGVLTVIDYQLRSTEPRLWVLDLDAGEVRFHERVAHGRNTGVDRARRFSNDEGSKQSSLGVFRTAETYRGKHGYSLRLDGLEPGFNDRARDRAIVIHGADYATEAFAVEHGRLGRSWGCPALDPAISGDVIDAIADGSLLVIYYPDDDWLAGSGYLDCDPAD